MPGAPDPEDEQDGIDGGGAARHRRVSGRPRSAGRWRSLAALALAALGTAAQAEAPSLLDAYPGRMVGVGSHHLHLHCRGSGRPTVVLESGIGGFSLEWREVQRRLARSMRVCAYDRAGYGWSEPGPLPRTARRSVEELHTVLHEAGETAPYLLVGHSYGGFIVRLFAERYREEVQGLVLVDASSPEQFERLPAAALPVVTPLPRAGTVTVAMPALAPNFPALYATTAMRLMMLPKARLALASELRHFAAGARQLAQLPAPVLQMPVIVLSRARSVFGRAAGGGASERIWRDMQHRMTLVSTRSDHWIAAGAGHQVHMDRPDLVALAVVHAGIGPLLTQADGGERLIVGEFPTRIAAAGVTPGAFDGPGGLGR